MKTIKIKDKEVLVDDDIYEQVKNEPWHITNHGYVAYAKMFNTKLEKRIHDHQYLHLFILPKVEGYVIDHINQNKLDNRRKNLRRLEHWQNLHNRPIQSNNTSGQKGVSWNNVQKQWHAYLWIKRKRIHLGYFTSYDEACDKRLEAEKQHLGFLNS